MPCPADPGLQQERHQAAHNPWNATPCQLADAEVAIKNKHMVPSTAHSKVGSSTGTMCGSLTWLMLWRPLGTCASSHQPHNSR